MSSPLSPRPDPLVPEWVGRVLGRPMRSLPLFPLARALRGQRVLVTGAAGSIGSELVRALRAAAVDVIGTDRVIGHAWMDVTSRHEVETVVARLRPTLILHMAGWKHAPEGELNPAGAAAVNVTGTENVLRAAERAGARVVTASTCKSCDPETAYGATKLIAERMTLQAGHSVARFHNVVDSAGNVFEQWNALPADAPLPVAAICRRYFIARSEAVGLVLAAPALEPGRYIVDPGRPATMGEIAIRFDRSRGMAIVPPRRGDRLSEPMVAASEMVHESGIAGILRVSTPHDCAAA